MASAAVSIAVWKDDEVLLIKRARPPFEGKWTLPGGVVEPGETSNQAVIRELSEETGLTVGQPRFACMRGTAATRTDYVLAVYAAPYVGGTPQAKDDASEVGWFDAGRMATLETTPELAGVLAETRILLTQE